MDAATGTRNRIILIFGLPRSGTTWLGKIFDSHPDTVYRHEPDTYPRLECLPRCPLPGELEHYRAPIDAFVAELPRMNSAAVAAKAPLFAKRWRKGIRQQVFRASVFAAKLSERVDLHLPVAGARAEGAQPVPVPVWKSIESLGRFGLLMHALPNATGIHLIRHPCGQIASVLRGEATARFRDSTPSSEYYGVFKALLDTPQARRRGLTLRALKRLTPDERLAWHWVLANEKAVEDVIGLPRARLVRYEDLCRDPAIVARDLFAFAGLDWSAQTQAFVHASTHAHNGAYYSVFKAPEQAAARWRDELPAAAVQRIFAIVGDSALGRLYANETAAAAAL
jgi:hypothetical protein